jgi:hypothetical protein
MKFLSVVTILACLACFTFACTEEQEPDPCNGVTCSGHGECVNLNGKPFCQCEPPYKPSASGKECKLACENVICSAHGICAEFEGQPQCICESGYLVTADGKSCVIDGDPCSGINCCGKGTCKVDGQGEPYCECTGGTTPHEKNPLCCTSPCEVVDECSGRMCTEENDCCGFGKCKVDEDGDAYCECEYAYRMDLYDRTCCVRTGEPLEAGQTCWSGTDCKTNFCLIYSGDETGYCSKRDCATNSECRNFSIDGNAMCCEDIGGENYACFKLGSGCNCGDSSGGCGASCACQSETACGANFVCLASAAAGLDDPNAYCSKQCNTHEDCNQCTDPDEPNTAFLCEAIGGGQKYCQPQRDEGCTRAGDCTGDEACIPFLSADGTALIGQCAAAGGLPTGAKCDSNADPNLLPDDERCAGFYCMYGYCSELCEFDSDCPEGMRCGQITFRLDDAGNITDTVGMCFGFDGSLQECGGYTDCPDGELCSFYASSNDELIKLCTTENCDMEEPDCSPPGTEGCGDPGADPCWGDLCLLSADGTSFCSAACETSEHCPSGSICVCCLPVTDTLSIPICFPFEGSADPCWWDGDCPNQEVCTYNQGLEGAEAICMEPNDPGAPVGAECGGTGMTACYNNLCVTAGSDSFCSAVCRLSAHCPSGYTCEGLNLGDDNPWGACIGSEDGSAAHCTSHSDCPAGEVCFYAGTPFSEVEPRCQNENAAGADPGAACPGGAADCANGLCISGTCGAVCNSNSACSQYSLECLWTSGVVSSLPLVHAPACRTPDAASPLCSLCDNDADCGGDSKCIESSANPGEKYCGLPCPNGDECDSIVHGQGPFSCMDVGGTVNNCRPDGDTCNPN